MKTDKKVEEIVKLNRNCGCTLGWCTECVKWRMVLTQHAEDMVNEERKRIKKEIELMPLMDIEWNGEPDEYEPYDMYDVITNCIKWRKNLLQKLTRE